MKKKGFIVILSILIVIGMSISSFANSVEITKEKLKHSFEKMEKEEKIYKFNVNEDNIGVVIDGQEYIVKYDLKGKPSFSYEVIINKGISYDEYKKNTSNLLLPFLGYVAVCDIQGVESKDSSTYYFKVMMTEGIKNNNNLKYVIVDDNNYNDEINNDMNKDKIVIKKSQFGEKVMEIIDDSYKGKNSFKDDSEGGINSFEMTSEKIKLSETSVKLKNTIKINLDADFSKLTGSSDHLNEAFLDKNITKENADYVVNLKVGQKCKFISNVDILGYTQSGSGIEVLKKDKNIYELLAKDEGKTNGYFNIGKNKKTYYIMVEKNPDNKVLEDIVIKIDIKEEHGKEEHKKDETPKTGENYLVEQISIALILISIIGIYIIMKKNKKDMEINK